VLADQGRSAAVVHRKERAMLSSALSSQAYFEQSLSGKKRKELRRQFNRLSEEGEVALHRQSDAGEIGRWADEFLALEEAGWKGAAGSALACDAATASLFREALHGAAQRGRLERLSLTLDGRAIAMLANFITAPGAFSYKTAFDEAYARFSPGVLLQQENLAMLDRSDIAWCDSCAAQDHPMIDHIWRERRVIARISIAIGGKARRALFRLLIRAETRAYPGVFA
jgi:CelD/BcsL family acetyltransferase involved in cellulose biosynthesis